MLKQVFMTFIAAITLSLCTVTHAEFMRGIYISQPNAQDPLFIKKHIRIAKELGINTFVMDLTRASNVYKLNVDRIKDAGIKYVARIVVFPRGGFPKQVKSEEYWRTKYYLAQKAIEYGADEIQLDYIRYSTKAPLRSTNTQDIDRIIRWFKAKLEKQNIPLQIDVFGETSYKPSRRIGQDIAVFADTVDAICPMLYPSHWEPYRVHAKQPYQTVYKALNHIKNRFGGKPPFAIYTWIEMYNYRYKFNYNDKLDYIEAQIKATEDAGVNGWYAWSPNNFYRDLFTVLRRR